ncbi:TraR/DksA C4-type zinc finger protein [Psychromonas sp.]|uniref:TraR/DksA C4-type zinc finger protein n=1 Tax=Psychromonas sp. TaxID=1884585 RepID=UPI00356389D1
MAPIDANKLNDFKKQLLASLEKLRNDVSEILMRSDHAGHKMAAKQIQKLSIDQLVELTSRMEISSISHKIKEIKSIDASLNDIEMGLYGFCSDCEEELDMTRLTEAPATKRCEHCEKKYQKQTYNKYKL